MNLQTCIRWENPPFCLLTPGQQVELKQKTEVQNYTTGQIIWSTNLDHPLSHWQFLILTGNIRLWEDGKSKSLGILKPGDWFGDLLQLSGNFRAVASSQEVLVLAWDGNLWKEFTAQAESPELKLFWQKLRSRYQSIDTDSPQSLPGYPFVFSLNTAAACLTMVSQYLQNPASLDYIQRQLSGVNPHDVMDGGEKLGLQIRQIQVTEQDLHTLSFPVLRLWGEDKEWIVVYGIKGNRVIIANPTNLAQTSETIPLHIFTENWNGQLWPIEPIPKQEKFNLTWFLPAVWYHRRLLFQVLLISFALQLLGLATPIITQFIIDRALVYGNLGTLDVMAIAMLGVAILESILGILRLFIFTHTANRLDLSLSSQLFRQLMRLPLTYFESRRVGDTVARAQEMENIRQFLTGTALTVILDGVFSLIYLILMLSYSVSLTGVALVVIPFFALLTLIATPILRNYLDKTFDRGADSQSFLVETVTGIHAIKAHAVERQSRRRWEGLFARYIRTSFKASTTANIGSNIGDFLNNFSYVIILWFGARLVIDQKLTIGGLVAFQMLSARVTEPILRLVELWQEFQQVLLSVDRLGDILNVTPEAEPGSGVMLPKLQGKVQFDKVVFRYKHDTPEPILNHISFTVEPGMFVGIVGRSGSWKSTLSKLLQRLYQPESGAIFVDDFDVKTADIGSLRQQINVVLQDDFFFNTSIAENITLGNPEITDEQIVQAAKMAVAHNFISELPQGYNTIIGERGMSLSGGQRQRIALSRLFLSQSPILILDEATSGLDSETEQKVLQNLQEISCNRTVFAIAHRFAPLKRANLILVLEKGQLVEQGTHDELLAKKGVYYALYQRQLSDI